MAVPYTFLNKRVPLSEYHIDANKVNQNFNSITETGEAFASNKVIGIENLKDNVIIHLAYGILGKTDTYSNLPTSNIYDKSIYLVENDEGSYEAGYYRYVAGTWTFFNPLVNLHHTKHEAGGSDEISLTNLKGTIINIDTIIENTADAGVTIEGILHKDGRLYVPTPVDDMEPTPKKWMEEYVQLYVQGLDYQNSVLDKDLTTPPSNPTDGDRYLLYNTPDTGTDWEGHVNDIAEWDAATSQWIFTTPNKGFTVPVEDENIQYTFNGTNWIDLPATVPHNNTTGLQGGQTNEYYHLTEQQRDDLVTHLVDDEKHRIIDDNNPSTITLYSGQKIEDELAKKADLKDYPLKWYITGFIEDGSEIDAPPSNNGKSAGEVWAVAHYNNTYNGNIYRVTDTDTWELLEHRSQGLGVVRSLDVKEFYYTTNDTLGEWQNYLASYDTHMSNTYFDNLLKNGDMEYWNSPTEPKDWRVATDTTSGSYTITQEDTTVRYGLYSIKVDVPTAYTDWGLVVYQVEDDGITTHTIKTHGVQTQYRMRAEVQASVTNAIFLAIDVKISGTWYYDYIVSNKNIYANTWESLTLVFTTQADWEEVVFKFRVAANTTGTFYFDTMVAYNGYVNIGYMGKSSEGGGNIGPIDALESETDAYIDIDTNEDSDEATAPNKVIIRKHKDGTPVDVFSIDEKGKAVNIITGKSILTPATKIVSKTGQGDYKFIQDGLDALANMGGGKLIIEEGVYDEEITFANSNYSNIWIQGYGFGTQIKPTGDKHCIHYLANDNNIVNTKVTDMLLDPYYANENKYGIYIEGNHQFRYNWFRNLKISDEEVETSQSNPPAWTRHNGIYFGAYDMFSNVIGEIIFQSLRQCIVSGNHQFRDNEIGLLGGIIITGFGDKDYAGISLNSDYMSDNRIFNIKFDMNGVSDWHYGRSIEVLGGGGSGRSIFVNNCFFTHTTDSGSKDGYAIYVDTMDHGQITHNHFNSTILHQIYVANPSSDMDISHNTQS